MFRLIKLALYAGVGYALYQFYLGLMDENSQLGQAARGQGKQGGGNQGRDTNAGMTPAGMMTGPAEGIEARTQDPSGMSTPHRVGRGVVRR